MMRRDLLEDEGNAERWMVSYADFITLLFAFFVVMYAISSVNEDKYKVLSNTLSQAFNVEASDLDPIQIGDPTTAASPHVVDIPDTEGWADVQPGDTHIEDPVDAAESMLGGFARLEGVSVATDNDWLELKIDAGVLFGAARAELSEEAGTILDGAVAVLRSNDNPVTIEGYTDNVPSQSRRYPSNWELSSARASSVARYLVESGIRAERIAAVGYGENHPLATNATPDGRAQNRRVVVVVARRSDLARNKNTATAVVTDQRFRPAEPVEAQRTAEGGLLFSADVNSEDELGTIEP